MTYSVLKVPLNPNQPTNLLLLLLLLLFNKTGWLWGNTPHAVTAYNFSICLAEVTKLYRQKSIAQGILPCGAIIIFYKLLIIALTASHTHTTAHWPFWVLTDGMIHLPFMVWYMYLCWLISRSAVSVVQYRGEFALVDISWMPIIIGMLANAIALPPNLLIALLFRRSVVWFHYAIWL